MQVPGVIQQSERQSKLIALQVIEGADRDPAHSAAFLDLEVERGEHAPFDIQPACADAREHDSADPRRAGAEAADDEALERATRPGAEASDREPFEVTAGAGPESADADPRHSASGTDTESADLD